MKKNLISRSEVETFYIEDKSNINFWLARTEKYSPQNVIKACLRAGASYDVAQEIARELDNYADSRIKMSEIRPLIYKLLLSKDRQAAKKFKAGEIYVDTSLETIEVFNRNKIVKSLIKETGLDESIAEQIAFETEKFIKNSNLDHVSAPLIREIVNFKLLEHGLKKERNLYTRIGMPVADLTNLINRGSKENANLQYNPETIHKIMADSVSKEYTMLKILPHDITDAHLKAQIHVHDMDYFCIDGETPIWTVNPEPHFTTIGNIIDEKINYNYSDVVVKRTNMKIFSGIDDSYPLNITHIIKRRPIGNFYKLVFSNGDCIKCLGMHKMFTLRLPYKKIRTIKYLSTKNLIENSKGFHIERSKFDIPKQITVTDELNFILNQVLYGRTIKERIIFRTEFNNKLETALNKLNIPYKKKFTNKTNRRKNIVINSKLWKEILVNLSKELKIIEIKTDQLSEGCLVQVPKDIKVKDNIKELNILEKIIKNKNKITEEDLLDNIGIKYFDGTIIPISKIKKINGNEQEILITYNRSKNTYKLPVRLKLNKDLMILISGVVAEGWLSKAKRKYNSKKSSYSVCFSNTNKQIIEKFRNAVKKIFNKNVYGSRKDNLITINFGSKIGYLLFKYVFEICGHANEKKLPDFIILAEKDKINALLDFYKKCDGNNKTEYYTSSKNISIQIKWLLRRLGKMTQTNTNNNMIIIKESFLNYVNFLGSKFICINKKHIHKKPKFVYDITCPETQRYVAGQSPIFVHNCTRPFCFSHDIRFFLKNGFKPDGIGTHTSVAGPAKKPEVAFLHAAKVLAAAQTNCFHPDEDVLIEENGIIKNLTIKETVDKLKNGSRLYSFGLDNWKIVKQPIIGFNEHYPNENMLEIELENGKKIRTLENHPMFIFDHGILEEKLAKNISVNDFIPIPISLNNDNTIDELDLIEELLKLDKKYLKNIYIHDNNRKIPIIDYDGSKISDSATINFAHSYVSIPAKIKITPEFMRLLGYFVSEGHIAWYDEKNIYDVVLSFGSHENRLIDDATQCVKKVFNITVNRSQPKERSFISLSFGGKLLALIFDKIIKTGKFAYNKRIPEIVFNVAKPLKIQFLKSYFYGDGHTHSKKEIIFDTVNKKLASDISFLLLQLGIVSRIREEFSEERILETRKIPSVLRYRIELSIDHIEKISNYIPQDIYKRMPAALLVPVNHAGMKKIYKEIKPSLSSLLYSSIMQKKRTSRYKIKQFLEKLKQYPLNEQQKIQVDNIMKFIEGDIGLLKVKKIKIIEKPDKVYDITTPTRSFIGCFGGVLAHNCAGGQGFSFFNTFMAPVVEGLSDKQMRQLAQMFIYEMSQMYVARGGQSLHYDDFVWIKENNEIKSVKIGEFIDKQINSNKKKVKKKGTMEILKLEHEIKTISLNPKTMKFKEYKITGISRHRPISDKLFEIKTKTGKKVRVTDFHSIYTIRNGKPVKVKATKLKKGDFLITPKNVNFEILSTKINLIEKLKQNAPKQILENIYVKKNNKKIPIKKFKCKIDEETKIGFVISKYASRSLEIPATLEITEEVATLLGLFIGDGSIRKQYSKNIYIYLSIPLSEKLDSKIKKIVRKMYFNNIKRINENDLRFGSNILKIIFLYVFNTGRLSTERTIPPIIFSMPRNIVCAFLRGLYSSDGSVYIKNKSGTVAIEYSTVNEKLVHDLSFLLSSRLGIIPDISIKQKNIKEINGVKINNCHLQFRLSINSFEQKYKFAKYIGFLQNNKNKTIERMLNNERFGLISKQHHTKRLPRDIVYNSFIESGLRVPSSIRTSRNIYEWSVSREIEKLQLNNTSDAPAILYKLLNSDIALDEIVDIKTIPTSKYVYDFEVSPEGISIENFLGGFGSVLVSNTVFSSIDLDMHVPDMLKDIPAIHLRGHTNGNTYGDYEDETRRLFNAFLDVYLEGDYTGKPFNFPKFEVQLDPNDLKKDRYSDELYKVSELAAKFGTPYYIIKQPYMPDFSCYQSIPGNEKILIIRNGKLINIEIGKYVDSIMKNNKIEKARGIEGEVEISNCNDYAISFDPKTLEIKKMKIEKVMRHKTKEKIFKLTLDGNRIFSGTEKHKIPIVRDNKIIEIRKEDVKQGDYLIGVKNIPLEFDFDRFIKFKNKNIEIDGKFARLLGYFASEGYLHKANKKTRYNKVSFSFNINEKVYINDVIEILKQKFDLNAKIDISKKNKTATVYVYSKELVELFEQLGTKRVPKIIMTSPWYIIKEFMLGLFRGDGSNSDKIDLHLCNKDLIDDIFVLGLRIGIPFEKYNGDNSCSLRITSSLRKNMFLNEIPFSLDIPVIGQKSFDFYQRIPTTPFNIQRKDLKKGYWNRSQIGKRITINRLKINNELYSRFLASDLHLFEIKKIEQIESEYVYDLVNVKEYHNFLTSDGIFSSNCCAYLMPLEDATDEEDLKNGTVRGGSLQVVTINLPQIAYEARGEDSRIFELIDERLAMIKRVMLLRKDLIEKNLQNGMLPFLSQKVDEKGTRYYEPSKQSYTVGVLGFNEMVKYHTGQELHESKQSWIFALKVMKYLKTKVAELRQETGLNFALARTPAESTAYRFALIDKKRYPNKAIYQGDDNTNSIYYTNSFHVRPNADVPLFYRMQIEGAFHPLTDGGAMCLDYNEEIIIKDKDGPKLIKIGEFVEKNLKNKKYLTDGSVYDDIKDIETIGINKKNKINNVKILRVMKIPVSDNNIFEITTKNNKKLKAVGRHKIFKLVNGEIKEVFIKDLQNQDTIIMFKNINFNEKNIHNFLPELINNPDVIFNEDYSLWKLKNTKRYYPTKIKLNRSFGEAVGFMISEGFKTISNKTILNGNYNIGATFGLHENHYANYFRNLIKKNFKNILTKTKNYISKEISVQLSDKNLHYIFSNIFNIGLDANNRTIPNSIIFSNKSVLTGLLDAAFAGDGTIDNRKNKAQPIYNTTSSKLANNISFICSLCGYENSINHIKRTNGKEFYTITLLRDSGKKFIENSKLFKIKVGKVQKRKSNMNGCLLNYNALPFDNLSEFYIRNRKIGKNINIHKDRMKKLLYLQHQTNITDNKVKKIIDNWIEVLNRLYKLDDIICGNMFYNHDIALDINISETVIRKSISMFKKYGKYKTNNYFSENIFNRIILKCKHYGSIIKNKIKQDIIKLKKLKNIINNLGFDIITDIKIKKTGSKYVYDIQTETSNFFTKQGILNHNSHIWFNDAHPEVEGVVKLTKQLATKTAIQYMAFTKDLTICNNCGFTVGTITDTCPNCQSKDIQNWSRITGYYQNISGWNKGKLQELKDRRRYGV